MNFSVISVIYGVSGDSGESTWSFEVFSVFIINGNTILFIKDGKINYLLLVLTLTN